MNKIKLYWDIISPTLGLILTALIIFFSVGMLLSIPLCLLWNWLMPYIFGLPKLNILQTFGLSILITLLSPKSFNLHEKKPEVDDISDVNKKLEEVLKDITSQFNA